MGRITHLHGSAHFTIPLRIQQRLIFTNVIPFSRLQLQAGYFIFFKFICVSSIFYQSLVTSLVQLKKQID